MSPRMGVDPEATKAPKPVAGNQWYRLKLKEIKASYGNKGQDKSTVNLKPTFEVTESAKSDDNGTKVFFVLAQKFPRAWVDFIHAFGLELTPTGDIPGDWIPDPKDPENVEKMQYKGVLLGRTVDAELIVDSYEGNENNKIKQFRCKIENCAQKHPDIKHMTNLVGNK